MKTGIHPKILSVVLSLIFFGSGFLHPIIHSCGHHSCEIEKNSSSVIGCCYGDSVAELYMVYKADSSQAIGMFCQICAGLLNFVFSPEAFRDIQHLPETVYHFALSRPVPNNDCQLPHTRAPPLS